MAIPWLRSARASPKDSGNKIVISTRTMPEVKNQMFDIWICGLTFHAFGKRGEVFTRGVIDNVELHIERLKIVNTCCPVGCLQP